MPDFALCDRALGLGVTQCETEIIRLYSMNKHLLKCYKSGRV